MMHYP